jgi:hypothetical protein
MDTAFKMREIIIADNKIKQLPAALSKLYPNATPAERQEIDSNIAGATNAEDALAQASTIREKQRVLVKGKVFQKRALSLLKRIKASSALPDVTGSREGDPDSWFGSSTRWDQAETDVVADIEEVTSILTSGNLDLMTGVLSETDIQLIRQMSAGGLNRKRGDDKFMDDLDEMIARFSNVIPDTVGTASGHTEGATAINKQTGQRIIYTNGQWGPA